MAVSYAAGSRAGNGQTATTATLSVPIPASAQAGDLFLVALNNNKQGQTLTAPSGFTTSSGPDLVGASATTWLCYKVLAAGDPGTSANFTFTTAGRCTATAVVLRGVDSTTLTVALGSITSGTSSNTLPSVSAPANALVAQLVAAGMNNTSAATFTTPSSYTADANNYAGTSYTTSPNGASQSFYKTITTAGSYGGETLTSSIGITGTAYAVAVGPSTSLSYSGSVSLSGSGALARSGTPKLTASKSLTGGSTLGRSGAPAIAAPLPRTGGGVLTFNGAAVPNASFSGGGTLAVSGGRAQLICRGVQAQRRMPVIPPVTALINFSKAILRIDGEWVEAEFPAAWQIDAADIYLPGGYETHVDADTANALTAAGYTVESIILE